MAIIDKPSDYFNTVTYTGNGASSRAISVGFQSDLVWNKPRTNTNDYQLVDSVRGGGKVISSNLTDAEYTAGNTILSFGSDGFTCGDGASVNANGVTYASWNWKAGGSASSNSNGSITSSVSANTDAGFSIVSYTGNGTGNINIGHGLGATPNFIIVKNRTTAQDWGTYSPSFVSASDPNVLYLSKTDGEADHTNVWGTSAAFNSNTFTVGDWTGSNQSGSSFIAYCFNDVQGFSKMGSYTGNGSTNGTFIYTGFSPAFVMVKRTNSANSWNIKDNRRNNASTSFNINPRNATLLPNDSAADQDANALDFLSNGFKNRSTGNDVNNASGTYIYMAFAENPFVTSTANGSIPACAR